MANNLKSSDVNEKFEAFVWHQHLVIKFMSSCKPFEMSEQALMHNLIPYELEVQTFQIVIGH